MRLCGPLGIRKPPSELSSLRRDPKANHLGESIGTFPKSIGLNPSVYQKNWSGSAMSQDQEHSQATAPDGTSVRGRLFLMMVLQFFIWGAWLPLIFAYLPGIGFTPWQTSLILNAFPVAAIVGMFFSNQFADRNFAAEKFLAFSHLVGGLAILGCGFTRSFWPFFLLMLVHCLLYVPTISITNSIAFANMKDATKEFGLVRMGGTIGWILAAWPFTFIFVDWVKVKEAAPSGFVDWLGTVLASPLTDKALLDATKWTFIVAGIASLILALYSLTLPHTPPKRAVSGNDGLAWMDAVRLLKHPFVLVLWLVTFIDAFVHNCYFNWTGGFLGASRQAGGVGIPGNWVMPVMSVGQIAEILTMFVLGVTLRFLVYALLPENQNLIILVQILHGICYAFFFATVYIFVDAYFPKNVRSSAQGLFNVMILGIGALVANSICPWLAENVFVQGAGAEKTINYRSMFLFPSAVATLAAIALALFFHPPKNLDTQTDPGSAPAH